jgi:hypothetical protein
VSQLNPGNAALCFDKPSNGHEAFGVGTGPDRCAARRDPAFWRDGGCFSNDERRSAYGPRPKMHEMPVTGKPARCRVLAHRRDADAVLERHILEAEFREE